MIVLEIYIVVILIQNCVPHFRPTNERQRLRLNFFIKDNRFRRRQKNLLNILETSSIKYQVSGPDFNKVLFISAQLIILFLSTKLFVDGNIFAN